MGFHKTLIPYILRSVKIQIVIAMKHIPSFFKKYFFLLALSLLPATPLHAAQGMLDEEGQATQPAQHEEEQKYQANDDHSANDYHQQPPANNNTPSQQPKVNHIIDPDDLDDIQEDVPGELKKIAKKISKNPAQQPNMMAVILHKEGQHYKYLLAGQSLLKAPTAQKRAHNLHYYVVKASDTHLMVQLLECLYHLPTYRLHQLFAYKPLCKACHLLNAKLFKQQLLQTDNPQACHPAPFPSPIDLSITALQCLKSKRFTGQQRQSLFSLSQAPVQAVAIKEEKKQPEDRGLDLPLTHELHRAVRSFGTETVVQFVLESAKIAINALDKHGKTALDYAQPNSQVYQLLVANGAKTSEQLPVQIAQIRNNNTGNPNNPDQDDEKEASINNPTRPIQPNLLNDEVVKNVPIKKPLQPKKKDSAKHEALSKLGQLLQQCNGHTDDVTSVAWRPDGKFLASGSTDKTIRIWNPKSGQQLQQCNGHTHWVLSVAWSPDGKQIASCSSDTTIRIWNMAGLAYLVGAMAMK